MTRLFLVRHALAAAPDDLRLPGPDLPLLPEGVAQAERLACRLLALAPSAVFTSDAARARETGEIIAATCNVSLAVLSALRELDFGDWGGKTYAEIVTAEPEARQWFADPSTGSPPGGEALSEAAARVLRVLAELGRDEQAGAVIVGHAGSLRLALAAALGMPLASYWRLRLDCASLTIVTWSEDGLVLERLNDTGHFATEHSGGLWEGTDASWGSTLTPLTRRLKSTRHFGTGRGGTNALSNGAQDGDWGEGEGWQAAGDASGRGSRVPATEDGP